MKLRILFGVAFLALVLVLIPLFLFGSVRPCGILAAKYRIAVIEGGVPPDVTFERADRLISNLTPAQCLGYAMREDPRRLIQRLASIVEPKPKAAQPKPAAETAKETARVAAPKSRAAPREPEWIAPDPSKRVALYQRDMMRDLRNFATQQEVYFAQPENNYTYSASIQNFPDFKLSRGVTLAVTTAGQTGWAATASHAGLAYTQTCAIFIGTVGTVPQPAAKPGVVVCSR